MNVSSLQSLPHVVYGFTPCTDHSKIQLVPTFTKDNTWDASDPRVELSAYMSTPNYPVYRDMCSLKKNSDSIDVTFNRFYKLKVLISGHLDIFDSSNEEKDTVTYKLSLDTRCTNRIVFFHEDSEYVFSLTLLDNDDRFTVVCRRYLKSDITG